MHRPVNGVVLVAVFVAACSPASAEPGGWQVTSPTVPTALSTPLAPGGIVVNAFSGDNDLRVMLAFPENEAASVIEFYRAWAASKDASETHGSEIAEFQAIWSIRWETSGVVVRITQCIEPTTREFTLVCAAIAEFR